MMSEVLIKVKMLGGFAITADENNITESMNNDILEKYTWTFTTESTLPCYFIE